MCVCVSYCHVRLFATQWTLVRQAPLSMEFSRQEYQSGLPFPSPGELPNPGTGPVYPVLAGRCVCVCVYVCLPLSLLGGANLQ